MHLRPILASEADPNRRAVCFPDGELSNAELRRRAGAVAAALPDDRGLPVAVWADASLATVVGFVGALACRRPVVPISPKAGVSELEHILADARPTVVLAGAHARAHETITAVDVIDPLSVSVGPSSALPAIPPDETPALVIYTSGTTGPPKGVILTHAAIAANLDALFDVWDWTAHDEVVQALPLFHVHGLVLGILGPLRLGGAVHHLGSFDPLTLADALRQTGTMLFAVPTMYHRLAAVAENDASVATALSSARLLVSGSAALDPALHTRLREITGHTVIERYGMSEALMITSTRLGDEPRPGYVGTPLPGVELQVRDDDGSEVPRDDQSVGGVWIRSPSLFAAYLNLPRETAATFRDTWFETGDLGCLAADGTLRLVGRRSTDLIKSGGFRIGAGEIEAALLSHPAVDEAAVLGLPDRDLGERVVAWVVPAVGTASEPDDLIAHVADQLAPYKRPREVRYVTGLPRNAMGKVQKRRLLPPAD